MISKKKLIEKTLIQNYHKYYKFAFYNTNNKEDALDILQETSYKCIKNSNSLNNINSIDNWIYKILINECYNTLKKRKNIINIEDISLKDNDTYINFDLQNAITLLDDEEKTIIILRFFEDLKLEDISSILNINLNTLKTKLYRSLKKLKNILNERI